MIQIADTIVHKKYVLDSALKMFHYLCSVNKEELGLELLKRAVVHDNSKLDNEELYLLSRISDREEAFTEPEYTLNEKQKQSIKLHWENNSHHPEHYDNPSQMSELDILEMVCDWHARSTQYDTNLIEFVKTRQKNRFNFEPKMYKKILKYCKIISK